MSASSGRSSRAPLKAAHFKTARLAFILRPLVTGGTTPCGANVYRAIANWLHPSPVHYDLLKADRQLRYRKQYEDILGEGETVCLSGQCVKIA